MIDIPKDNTVFKSTKSGLIVSAKDIKEKAISKNQKYISISKNDSFSKNLSCKI